MVIMHGKYVPIKVKNWKKQNVTLLRERNREHKYKQCLTQPGIY